MAGPWDNYQPQAAEAGPWAKYGAPPPIASNNDGQAPVTLNQHRGSFSGTIPPKPILQSVGELGAGVLKNVADVTAPVIGHRLLQRHGLLPSGDLYPGEGQLRDVPEKATLMMAGEMGEPDAIPEPGIARPTPRVAAPKSSPDAAPGMIGRAGEVAVRRVGRIPGVQAAKDIDYIVRGPKIAPEEAPAPKTPVVPPDFGTPQELRGTRINQELENSRGLAAGGHTIADPSAGLGRIATPGKAGSMVESIAEPDEPLPTLRDIPKKEWDAGQALGSEVEGTPRPPLTERIGERLAKNMEKLKAEDEAESEIAKPKIQPNDKPLTSILRKSVAKVKAEKAARIARPN
jgi:hypothetical protein